MKITKRNHYNPCFWTALWNPDYFDSFIKGTSSKLGVREQMVYALSVKSGNIFHSKVDNIHFEKNLGMAEITFEASINFYKRYHPQEFEEFRKRNKPEDYPVFIDLEDLLTQLEKSRVYKNILLETIRNQTIITPFEKGALACFVYIQLLRGHAAMSSLLEWNAEIGKDKFEYFVLLRWALSNKKFLHAQIDPILLTRWVFYRMPADTFPLSDSPILIKGESVMVTLSPRLLLEILPEHALDEISWDIKEGIDKHKLEEFRRRTIGNTFREIIFSNKELLEEWRQTEEFEKRVSVISNMKSYNARVVKEKQELWQLNVFGNQNVSKTASKQKRPRRRK
ncbi:MAG: hypothetical protein AABZ00_03980 [Chloroflexota bacterium]